MKFESTLKGEDGVVHAVYSYFADDPAIEQDGREAPVVAWTSCGQRYNLDERDVVYGSRKPNCLGCLGA